MHFTEGQLKLFKMVPYHFVCPASFEADEFESDLTEKRKAFLSNVAEETSKKDKRINIRISSRDLTALQRRVLEEGLPYQTLVSSILHKYVSGGLQDIAANKLHLRTS